jgi:hypothetical protein
MINDPQTYRDYFEDIYNNNAANVSGYTLLAFEYGDSRRVMERMKSDLDYPLLWLEFPDFTLANNGAGFTVVTQGAFMVLRYCEIDNWDAQNAALQECYSLASMIVKRLSDDNIFLPGRKATIDSVATYFGDNCYGVRCGFNLEGDAEMVC